MHSQGIATVPGKRQGCRCPNTGGVASRVQASIRQPAPPPTAAPSCQSRQPQPQPQPHPVARCEEQGEHRVEGHCVECDCAALEAAGGHQGCIAALHQPHALQHLAARGRQAVRWPGAPWDGWGWAPLLSKVVGLLPAAAAVLHCMARKQWRFCSLHLRFGFTHTHLTGAFRTSVSPTAQQQSSRAPATASREVRWREISATCIVPVCSGYTAGRIQWGTREHGCPSGHVAVARWEHEHVLGPGKQPDWQWV